MVGVGVEVSLSSSVGRDLSVRERRLGRRMERSGEVGVENDCGNCVWVGKNNDDAALNEVVEKVGEDDRGIVVGGVWV